MAAPEKRSPARVGARNRAGYCFNRSQLDSTTRPELKAFARRIHTCGPRVIFELFADLLRGREVGETFRDFARLDPATYSALVAIFTGEARA